MLITENEGHSPQNGTQQSPIRPNRRSTICGVLGSELEQLQLELPPRVNSRHKSIFGGSDSNQNGGSQGGNYKRYQSLCDVIDGSRRVEFNRNKSMFDDTAAGTCIIGILLK